MSTPIQRIAINTGGGDAPGLNAVIQAAVRAGHARGWDRILGLSFGTAAGRALAEGENGVMVALNPPHIQYVPLEQAIARTKLVPLDGESVLTARTLGIALGD